MKIRHFLPLLLLAVVAIPARAQTTVLGGKTFVRSEVCLTGAVVGINPDGTIICGASGAGSAWQNQGSLLGVPNVVNCLTNLTCSIVGSTLTISATGGGTIPTGTGFTHITGGGQDSAAKLVSLTTDTAANQGTTITVLHGNAGGQPSFGPTTPADAAGNTSGSGNFCLVTNCAMTAPNLGTPSAINLSNATGAPTWNQSTTGTAANVTGIVAPANGGCGIASPTAHTIPIAEGSSNCTYIGTGKTGQTLGFVNGADPSPFSPGVAGTDVNSATYTVQCDSGTTLIDRATTLRFITTAPTVTMPDPTASGCGSNFPVTLIASGVTVTVNRTTTAVFNIYNGSAPTLAATTFNLTTGQYATLTSPDNVNWLVRVVSGSGGTPTYPVTVAGTVNSGGIPCFTSTTQSSSSGLMTANVYMKGGGAGACPSPGLTTDDGTSSTYTGTGGTKSPAFTSTGTTAGFVDYPQGTTSAAVAPCNTATSICEQAPAAVTSYLLTKPGAAPTIASYKQTDTCGSAICTESFHPVPIVLTVTADFTDASSTSLQAITGLGFTFPANKALNAKVDCDILYNQTVAAVADAWGVQDVTVAPTNVEATGFTQTAATTWAEQQLLTLTTTTATNIGTFTPSAITTVWHAQLHALVEHPSNASTSAFNVMVSQSTAADLMVIKRGSACTVTFQ